VNASAKANQVEPWTWHHDIFASLPLIDDANSADTDSAALDALLPDRWLSAHPTHRWHINDLRQRERKRSQKLRQAIRRR
jgi:hypothetical protein